MCAANCIMQVILNDEKCWKMITQLNDDDILKKIAIKFTTVTNGNRSINLCDLYNNFVPIIEAKNDEKDNYDTILSVFLNELKKFKVDTSNSCRIVKASKSPQYFFLNFILLMILNNSSLST